MSEPRVDQATNLDALGKDPSASEDSQTRVERPAAEAPGPRAPIHRSSGPVEETQYQILRRYHQQSLGQSKVSFWFSLVFAAFGFMIIAAAIFLLRQDRGLSQQSASIIALLAGTIIDVVASLFMVQSRRSQRLMQEFFERLRDDRKLEESLALTSKLTDPIIRNRLQTVLALHFAEAQPAEAMLSTIFSSQQTLDATVKGLDEGWRSENLPPAEGPQRTASSKP
jgi:hypothetical protein